jgi:hypothetical protein
MMDVCVSVVTRQNTTSNERERENVRKGGRETIITSTQEQQHTN